MLLSSFGNLIIPHPRLIESDTRSLNSLSDANTGNSQGLPSGHSRMSSITSQISNKSSDEQMVTASGEEDLWTTWGKLLNEWDSNFKKNNNTVKVLFFMHWSRCHVAEIQLLLQF